MFLGVMLGVLMYLRMVLSSKVGVNVKKFERVVKVYWMIRLFLKYLSMC